MQNREAKFRAYHETEKRWWYFTLSDIATSGLIQRNWLRLINRTEYTGIKDESGSEIFEGDIITTPTRFVHDTLDAFGVVTFLAPGFTSVGFGDFAGAHYQIQYNSEIIGNIFEHSQLLTTPTHADH